MQHGEFARALHACTSTFERDGDLEAGVSVAVAAMELGDVQALRAQAHRLEGTTEAGTGWALLGLCHERAGRNDSAADAYARAQLRFEDASDWARATQAARGRVNVLWANSNFRLALPAVDEMFRNAERTGDATVSGQMALSAFPTLFDAGDRPMARWVLDRAATHIPSDDIAAHGRLQLAEGRMSEAVGRPRLAAVQYRDAIAKLANVDDPASLRAAQYNLAQLSIEANDLDEAEVLLQDIERAGLPDASNPQVAWRFFRARLDLARGQPSRAEQRLRATAEHRPALDWQWEIDLALGQALRQRHELAAATEAIERSIAVVEKLRRQTAALPGWVAEARRRPYEELFETYLAREMHQAAIVAIQRGRERALFDALQEGEQQAAPARWDLAATMSNFDRAQTVRRASNRKPTPQLPTNIAAWSYFVANGTLYRIEVGEGPATIVQLAVSTGELGRWVDAWLADLDDMATGRRLANAILPPVLPVGGTIHIVTDGPLGRIPFAALPWKDKRLVDHLGTAYLPSLAALRPRQPSPRAPAGVSVLADALGDLPQGRAEAQWVAHRHGVVPFVGDEANVMNLDRSGLSRLLHIAVHAGLDEYGAWLEVADGRLYAADILGLAIEPELVVVSSCAAAARPGRAMWGSVGAAFLAKGAHAVLAPLWSVDDAEARSIVESFYAADGLADPPLALRRAQRAARARGTPTSQWAAFVLLGAGVSAEKNTE